MDDSLGKKIYQLRKKKGMTQEQLANYLNISNAAISKWENNISYPDISILKPLARTLAISVDELLNFQESLSDEEINTIKKSIANLYEEGKVEEAITISESNLREYPTDLRLKFQIASLYFRYSIAKYEESFAKQQLMKSQKLFEECLKCEDKTIYEASVQILISLYSSNEELDKAMALIDTLPSNYQDSRILKASILSQKGNVEEAIKLEQTCIWSEFQNININILSLANKAAKQNQYDDAIRILDHCFHLYDALGLNNLLTIGINHYVLKMELLIKTHRMDEVKAILRLLLKLYEQSQYLPTCDHLLFNTITSSLQINVSKAYLDRNLFLLLTQGHHLEAIKKTTEYKMLIEKISSSL